MAVESAIDADELAQTKAALIELNKREGSARLPSLRPKRATAPAQGGIADLRSLVAASPELSKLGALREKRQEAKREAQVASQAEMRAEAEKHQAAVAASIAAADAARAQAIGLLKDPYTSSVVQLEEPFLIWQFPFLSDIENPPVHADPHPELFRDSHIEPLNSWAKIFLSTSDGQDDTTFRFYFQWINPSDYYAVVNAGSFLSLNGQASAHGSSGIFSGNGAQLGIDCFLNVIRWTGWGVDPNTGQSNDQTAYPGYTGGGYKNIAWLDASGGNLFSDSTFPAVDFDPQKPYDLSIDFVAIPGRAVTLFEVGLRVNYGFPDGGDEFAGVTLDLAFDPLGYMARCPMVALEILTPPA